MSCEIRKHTDSVSQLIDALSHEFSCSVYDNGGVIEELALDIICGILADLSVFKIQVHIHAFQELEEVLIQLVNLELVILCAPAEHTCC